MTTWDERLTFEVSSADPDDTPVWVDLSVYVRDLLQVPETAAGRQNDLDQTEPAPMTLLLDNVDDRFTFGNTLSPYAAWWGPGRKCRIRERVGILSVDLFTGYLEVPTETAVTEGREQWVSLSAVDRLGRMDRAGAFTSTLGAHILGSARNGALVSFTPLTDAAAPFRDLAGSFPANYVVLASSLRPAEQFASANYRGAPSLPGDDVNGVELVPALNAGAISDSPSIRTDFYPNYPTLAAGQILTAVVWVRRDAQFNDGDDLLDIGRFDGVIDLFRDNSSSPSHYHLTSPVGSLTGSIDSSGGLSDSSDRWSITAFRFGFSPNVLEMWVDDQVFTGTLSGVFAGPEKITTLSTAVTGGVLYRQLYIGAATDFTHEDFLAQRAVGLTGLERQTTGDRVRSIAQYAGVPTGQLSQVDSGTAVMSRALLAGKTPLEALREPERTERGLLYVDGSGDLVFADRRRLYNI